MDRTGVRAMQLTVSVLAAILAVAHSQDCVLDAPALTDAQLTSICGGLAAFSSPACSIQRLCSNTALSPPVFPQICNTTRISSTLCLDDGAVTQTIPECASFVASAALASSAVCIQKFGVFSIRSTQKTKAAAVENCAVMAGMPMVGCDQCSSLDACPDPLVSLGQGCADMPEMTICTQTQEPSIRAFCGRDANIGGYGFAAASVCVLPAFRSRINAPPRAPAPVSSPPAVETPSPAPSPVVTPAPVGALPTPAPSPSPAPTTTTPAPTTRSVTQDPCVASPTASTCQGYEYPAANIQADIGSLCGAMPDMPGCSISKACASGQLPASSKWCAPFTLLATLCADMPGMTGCGNYTSMCQAGSVVKQCAAFPAIPNAPSWTASRNAVFSICGEMSMTQCSQCSRTSCPSPLSTLVALCADMPDMSQCQVVSTWCQSVNSAGGGLDFFCVAGGEGHSGLPPMTMYFHQRLEEIILWKEWVPKSTGAYVGAIIAVLAFGVVSMSLKAYSAVLSIRWRHPRVPVEVSQHWWLPTRSQVPHNAIKGALTGLATCLDYFNMLVAMTFNIGLFVAVVVGYALGTLLVSHLPDNYSTHLAQERARHQSNILSTDMENGGLKKHGPGTESSMSDGSPRGNETGRLRDAGSPACCPAAPL